MKKLTLLLIPCLAAAARGGEISLTIEIPRLEVAEYHRPYIAAWIEKPDGTVAANLAVWYDSEMKDKEGETWLKDIRQWWRKSGRDLAMPMDGVSGAKSPLDKLPAGDYQVVVEAAREVGGRELVRVPFQWPPKAAAAVPAKGKEELGAVAVQLKP